jgi:branched-chain amino acid transport system substrate-binding protein
MFYTVVFRIKGGSFETGFRINAEIRQNGTTISSEEGWLSAAPQLPKLYEQTFPKDYSLWGSRSKWGERVLVDGDTTVIIRTRCAKNANQLEKNFQKWLKDSDLIDIQTKLALLLHKNINPVFILEPYHDPLFQKLPWHQWQWLIKYFPHAEIVLSNQSFVVNPHKGRAKVLVVMGSTANIDLQPDWEAFNHNIAPLASLKYLLQPELSQLRQQVRYGHYQILFFAGHSATTPFDTNTLHNETGNINDGTLQINDRQQIAIGNLAGELSQSVRNGLQLAFFNSCDGLGIANRLLELGVPYVVVMREPVHNDVAATFVAKCLENLAQGSSLTAAVAAARPELRDLESQYICASWMPVILQSREAPEFFLPLPTLWEKMGLLFQKQRSWIRYGAIASSFMVGLYLAIALFWHPPQVPVATKTIPPVVLSSLGEKLLFSEIKTPEKQQGIAAFSDRQYDRAAEFFQQSLQKSPNDPESRIYLNNARVLSDPIKAAQATQLAAISSADKGFDTSQEVLRGFGQGQMEINAGSNPLLLKIVVDNNDKELGAAAAKRIVADPQIKAVLGHLDSNVSVTAGPIYDQAKVVMMTPTSSAMELVASRSPYLFRTAPNSRAMADTLASYLSKQARKSKIGFCYDGKLQSAESLRDELNGAMRSEHGWVLTNIRCNINSEKFNPQESIKQMKREGADALVLYFHFNTKDSLDKPFGILDANQATPNPLPLFSAHSLVAPRVLANGEKFANMVLVTPRHPDRIISKELTSFVARAEQLWQQKPMWREITSFDAIQAMHRAIEQSDHSRQGIQKALHAKNFVASGTTPVKFTAEGERDGDTKSDMTQVKFQDGKWQFVLLQNPNVSS